MMIGRRIGKHRIVRRIGSGGAGNVFEAVHVAIGHRVAIKLLPAALVDSDRHPEYVRRFFDEARAVNLVRHPSIVEIFDFGMLPDGAVYLLMQYLDGETLWDRLCRLHGRLDVRSVLRIGRQLASALAAAHARGVLHRDLKPDNVVIVSDPEVPAGERPVVLDFGVAKFVNASYRQTTLGSPIGTPYYMSPEQCRGEDEVDGTTDVYALGTLLYELLAGRPPFDAPIPLALMLKHISQPPPPLRDVAPWVEEPVHALVHRMLAKRPAARPPMVQVEGRLRQLAEGFAARG